jgi:hypothetical protein
LSSIVPIDFSNTAKHGLTNESFLGLTGYKGLLIIIIYHNPLAEQKEKDFVNPANDVQLTV